jgi:hypothetical protein
MKCFKKRPTCKFTPGLFLFYLLSHSIFAILTTPCPSFEFLPIFYRCYLCKHFVFHVSCLLFCPSEQLGRWEAAPLHGGIPAQTPSAEQHRQEQVWKQKRGFPQEPGPVAGTFFQFFFTVTMVTVVTAVLCPPLQGRTAPSCRTCWLTSATWRTCPTCSPPPPPRPGPACHASTSTRPAGRTKVSSVWVHSGSAATCTFTILLKKSNSEKLYFFPGGNFICGQTHTNKTYFDNICW